MKMKLSSYILLFALSMLVLVTNTGFSIDDDDQDQEEIILTPLMQNALDAKLDKYRNTILKKCRERAIEEAELFVDSLISVSTDTLPFPRKPVRPGLPEKIILNDSTGIKPIID